MLWLDVLRAWSYPCSWSADLKPPNLQGQPATSWHDFADEIMRQAVELRLLERSPVVTPISTAAFPTPAQRPANSRLDCGSAQLELGQALPAWREDLREFLLAAAQPPVHP